MAEDSAGTRFRGEYFENSSFACHAVIFFAALLSFLPEVFYTSGYDHVNHLSWSFGFGETLRAGALYPRWLRDINQGDGGPLFVFYGPVFYYVTALFSWKFSVLASVKLAVFFLWWGAGAAMFVCARQWLGRTASLLAALVYLLLPYRFYALYRSAVFAELSQYVWVPLILRRFARLGSGGQRNVILLGACLAGAIVTHLVTALILFYFLIAAGVILLVRHRPSAWQLLAAALWSLGFSAVYLLPALAERAFINPFLLDTLWNFERKFRLDLGHLWTLSIFSGLVLLIGVQGYGIFRNPAGSQPGRWLRRPEPWLLGAAAAALFMLTPLSQLAWRLPGLAYVMFPLRWLLVPCVVAALLAGFQFERKNSAGRLWRAALLIAVVANLILSGVEWRNAAKLALTNGPDWTQAARVLATARYHTEFTAPPAWVPNPQQRFTFDRDPALAGSPLSLLQGSGASRVQEWSPISRRIALQLASPALVELRTFYYPGWGCTLDSAQLPLEVSARGRLQVAAPAGAHQLTCNFSNTGDRTAGAAISLLSAFAALLVFARSSRDT